MHDRHGYDGTVNAVIELNVVESAAADSSTTSAAQRAVMRSRTRNLKLGVCRSLHEKLFDRFRCQRRPIKVSVIWLLSAASAVPQQIPMWQDMQREIEQKLDQQTERISSLEGHDARFRASTYRGTLPGDSDEAEQSSALSLAVNGMPAPPDKESVQMHDIRDLRDRLICGFFQHEQGTCLIGKNRKPRFQRLTGGIGCHTFRATDIPASLKNGAPSTRPETRRSRQLEDQRSLRSPRRQDFTLGRGKDCDLNRAVESKNTVGAELMVADSNNQRNENSGGLKCAIVQNQRTTA